MAEKLFLGSAIFGTVVMTVAQARVSTRRGFQLFACMSAEETGNDTHHFGARAKISMGEALSNCCTSSELRDCSTAGPGLYFNPSSGKYSSVGAA